MFLWADAAPNNNADKAKLRIMNYEIDRKETTTKILGKKMEMRY